jgi:hypothetical protein
LLVEGGEGRHQRTKLPQSLHEMVVDGEADMVRRSTGAFHDLHDDVAH